MASCAAPFLHLPLFYALHSAVIAAALGSLALPAFRARMGTYHPPLPGYVESFETTAVTAFALVVAVGFVVRRRQRPAT
jgi:hypothetical protein